MKLWATLLMLMLLGATTTSEAQVSHQPTAAVLEIQVRAPSGSSRALSRAATDAVAAAMSRRNLFVVKPRNATEQAIKDLGYHQAVNTNQSQVLGRKLDVDMVVSGEVTEISFTENPRRAHVKLSLSMINVMIVELAYSTSKTGDSLPDSTGRDVVLIEQAINSASEAAFDSFRAMPKADIIAHERDELVLNVGSRDGLRVGNEAIVVRGGERLARLRIYSISATRSKASFVEGGRKTRPGDQAIFIFVSPSASQEK